MLKARTKLTPTSARTREHLILAGERLFAEQGLDNVSLRQINSEAGQRNSSASHYHFGSKESLVTAIYEYRFQNLNKRRNAMLAALPPTEDARPVSTLMELLVFPIVEEIDNSEGGNHFIRFMAQVLGHPKSSLVEFWRTQFDGSVGHVYYGLRKALPDIPDEVFGPRFGLTWILAVNGLADRQRLSEIHERLVACTRPALYFANLVDVLSSVMSAPPSPSTLSEIRKLRTRGEHRT
ncbi:MAG: TetR/AcrR family transcriptional regulator [Gammaproteobacteria bacterium]|nr:TetR/AcrR family transcriptional regulator [Gammaproteobacteria bacterium]